MPKTQQTFTQEFKLEAVQLVKTSNKPLAQIASNLGIADSTLHYWRQLEASHGEQGFPGSGHQTARIGPVASPLRWLDSGGAHRTALSSTTAIYLVRG